MRILVVEDDSVLREMLSRSLAEAGHRVDIASKLADAEQLWQYQPFDAILLDLNLPDGNALDGLRRARNRGDRTPVMVLTARNRTDERIAGLDAGADDYLGKPFELDEVEARLRALVRRAHGVPTTRLTLGDVSLDPAARQVWQGDALVELSVREFDLLHVFALHAGRVLTREQIEQHLYKWGSEVSSNAVEVHIYHLRRKLGAELIETIRGVGYVARKP